MYLPLKASSIKGIKIKTYTLDLHFLGVAHGLLPSSLGYSRILEEEEGMLLFIQCGICRDGS
jgi:hypothetical protein